jgi:hypothetical protein
MATPPDGRAWWRGTPPVAEPTRTVARVHRLSERAALVVVVGVTATAIVLDVVAPRFRSWLNGHSLTTNLVASALFAVAVYFSLERAAQRREVARWKPAATEALGALVWGWGTATRQLEEMIGDRADAVDPDHTHRGRTPLTLPDSVASLAFSPAGRDHLQKLTGALRAIAQADLSWFKDTLAVRAEALANDASQRLTSSAQLLGLAGIEDDLGYLRMGSSYLRTVAEQAAGLEEWLDRMRPPDVGPMESLGTQLLGLPAREPFDEMAAIDVHLQGIAVNLALSRSHREFLARMPTLDHA